MHESSDEFEFRLDWTTDCGVSCHFLSAVLYRIIFILAGNDYIHKSLNDFEIQPDSTTGFHGDR